jgi:hypothetical protein
MSVFPLYINAKMPSNGHQAHYPGPGLWFSDCIQTALIQACQYGHWEVVETLILFNVNVSIYILNPTAMFFIVSWIHDFDMAT